MGRTWCGEQERRAELKVGDRVEVAVHRSGWVKGTIVEESEPDEFAVALDTGRNTYPHRLSPHLRPLNLLELLAEAAADEPAR